MKIYETKDGDQWDLISKKVYGSEIYFNYLIDANIEYIEVFQFPAGVILAVPDLPDDTDEELLPAWKRG